jgi:putative protease
MKKKKAAKKTLKPKKVTRKAPRRKAPRPRPSVRPKLPVARKAVGAVTHYYGEIGVAVIRFSKAVPAGTEVAFRGATTDFTQTLDSMQFDHKPLASAPKGKEIGVKVKDRVREGDEVFLVA